MIPEKFTQFIEEISKDGGWQYSDGTSMTRDAQITLKTIRRFSTVKAQTHADPCPCCGGCEFYCVECLTKTKHIEDLFED